MYILVVRKSLSLSKTLNLIDGFRQKRQGLFLIVIIHWNRMSSQLQKNLLLLDNTLHSKAKWKTNRQFSDFEADNLMNIKQEQLLPMQP